MLRFSWTRTIAIAAFAIGAVAPASSRAQGITTAAISGTVTDENGQPIEAAQVQVTNRSTGVQTGQVTGAGGRFFVQGLETGGPYMIIVRRIGYHADSLGGINLQLGQNFRATFKLTPQAVQLATVTVTASSDSVNAIIGPARRGIQTNISDTALRRLPTLNRNFTDFLALTPQVAVAQSGGLSGGGQNNRFNDIQIDGSSEADLFGLGTTGQPGGQARGRSISLEAVKEYQVLLSPYDVRQGNFTGALLNAVTKSGTNEFHGSAYYYFRNQDLARDVPLLRNTTFNQKQFGFSVGGPIVKDKIHFFVAPEWQREEYPTPGPFIGQGADVSPAPLASPTTVQQFTDALKNTYGFDPGSPGAALNTNPLTNVFARLDFALPWNSRLVLRYNYGKANLDTLYRFNNNLRFTSNAYSFNNTKHAPVVQLFTNWNNGAANELFLGYTRIRDNRPPASFFPQVTLSTLTEGSLVAGAELNSQGNALSQDIYEVTDNFSFNVGEKHRVTVGTHNEWLKVANLFGQDSYGVYTFKSVDSLIAGNPNSYTIGLNLGAGFNSKFNAANYSVYAEDQWTLNDRFNIQYGLRLDVPTFSPTPPHNELIQTDFGRDNTQVPTGNIQWSPRLGFNWDITGKQTDQLRGGAGLFVGRPAYVWMSNVIANSGFGVGLLTCGQGGIGRAPQFSPDPRNQPQACVDSLGNPTGAGGYSEVDLLSKNLKFPQTFRTTLGYDHQFGNGFVGTVEGMYTRGINSLFYKNLNIANPVGTDAQGRVIYATAVNPATGAPTVGVLFPQFRANGVIDVENQSHDYQYSLTGQLKKRFSDRLEASAAYTYGHSYTVQDITSSRAISNWRFARELSGNLLDKNTTGISLFDVPNKVTVAGTYTAPWTNWQTTVSMIYIGQSGVPFDYVAGGRSGAGDLNGDNVTGNDLIYVPTDARDPSQMQFKDAVVGGQLVTAATQAQLFEQFINGSDCLSSHRGRILPRNSCRSPWQNNMNMTVEQSLPSLQGKTVTLRLDIFNFLNVIDKDWGKIKLPANSPSFNNQTLVNVVGYTGSDPLTSQPIFNFLPASQTRWASNFVGSYYQIQLSARVGF